jgi:hypothetical protein
VFGAAFDEATQDIKKEDRADAERDLSAIPAQDTVPPPVEEPGTDFPPDTPPLDDAGTAGTSAVSPDVVVPQTPEWATKEADYQERIRTLEAAAAAKPPADTPKEPVVQPTPDVLSVDDLMASLKEDEKQALELYNQEYEEVSKFEGLKRQLEVKAIEARYEARLKTAIETLTTSIAPILRVAQEYGREKHENAIRAKHEDFEQLRDDGSVEKWIATRPAGLREQYQKWYDNGNTSEVITLMDEFKASTGRATAIPDEPNPKPKTPRAIILRKGPILPVHRAGKDDFAGAFDEATRGL